jgi:hypothetical protein
MPAADAEPAITRIAAESAADAYQIFTVAPSPKVLQKVRKAERIEGLSPTFSIWAEKHRVFLSGVRSNGSDALIVKDKRK